MSNQPERQRRWTNETECPMSGLTGEKEYRTEAECPTSLYVQPRQNVYRDEMSNEPVHPTKTECPTCRNVEPKRTNETECPMGHLTGETESPTSISVKPRRIVQRRQNIQGA
ncbi:hypothetical protein MRX96_005125 [Rhipicephalus microplus]